MRVRHEGTLFWASVVLLCLLAGKLFWIGLFPSAPRPITSAAVLGSGSSPAEPSQRAARARYSNASLLSPLAPGGEVRIDVRVTNPTGAAGVAEVRFRPPFGTHSSAPSCDVGDFFDYSDDPLLPDATELFRIRNVFLPETLVVGEPVMLIIWVSDLGAPTDTLEVHGILGDPKASNAILYDGEPCALPANDEVAQRLVPPFEPSGSMSPTESVESGETQTPPAASRLEPTATATTLTSTGSAERRQPTIAPLARQPTLPTFANYLDIGAASGDQLVGGGFLAPEDVSSLGDGWDCRLPGYADWTVRDMEQTGNSVVYAPVEPGRAAVLTLCVARGTEPDSWELWLGGKRPEWCAGTVFAEEPERRQEGPIVHGPITIPASCVVDDRLVLAFTTKSNPGIGLWGILVSQEPSGRP